MVEEALRLFIAINFDHNTKQKILEVQSHLKAKGKGRFTTEENLHLTLAFLGETKEECLPELKALLDSIPVPEMNLIFSSIGCFRNDSELWWIGIKDNSSLISLQKGITEKLREKGFWFDSKRFKPHITLAREMHIGRIDTTDLLPIQFHTTVNSVSLMLSERVNGRLRYTELYKVQ